MRPSTKHATEHTERAAMEGNALASVDGAPDITVVVDTREQAPWTFDGSVLRTLSEIGSAAGVKVATVRGTLDTGDYALLGREDAARIERKSLEDFVACCGRERERFWRELERLARFPTRAVIIEATITSIEFATYRSRISPIAIMASACAITADFGIPVVWAGTRQTAEWMCAWTLRRVQQRALRAEGAAP
jgi:ERCC4-type nuclease